MENNGVKNINFVDACAIYEGSGICCEKIDGIFYLTMKINQQHHIFQEELLIAPLRAVKLISKTEENKNCLEMLVATSDLSICMVCPVTPRELRNQNWLTEKISCSQGLFMGGKAYAPYLAKAIQISKILNNINIFTQSGWYDGIYVFGDEIICRPDSPYKNDIARSEYTCADAGVDKSLTEADVAESIVNTAFRIVRPGAVAAMFSIGHLGYLYEDLRDRNGAALPRLTPQIIASTNNGKTTLISKIACPRLQSNFVISAQSTSVGLSSFLQQRFSHIVIAEDFNPQQAAADRKQREEAVLRSVGDRNSQRMTAKSIKDGALPVSTFAIFTAEDYKVTGESSIARTLPIKIQWGRQTWEMIEALPDTVVATFYYRLLEAYIHKKGFEMLEARFMQHRKKLQKKHSQRKFLPRMIDNIATVRAGWDFVTDWLTAAAPALKDKVEGFTDDLDNYLDEMITFQYSRMSEEAPEYLFILELWRRYNASETKFLKVTSEGKSTLKAEGYTAADVIETSDSLFMNIDLEEDIRVKLDCKEKSGRRDLREALGKSGYLIRPINSSYYSSQKEINGSKSISFIRLDKKNVFETFENFE